MEEPPMPAVAAAELPIEIADPAAKPLVATLTSGDQRWVVRYDGLTATASSAPTA